MRFRFRPRLLPALVMAAVLLAGLGSNIGALLSPGDSPRAYSWHDIAAGEPTADLGQFLLHHNPFADALVTVDRVVAWNTLGDLGARVRRGCDNWLFLADEMEIHKDREQSLVRHLRIVQKVAAYLSARHIALAVALVPDKSRVESAELCGVDRAAMLGPRYQSAMTGFLASAVPVRSVDLLTPLAALDGERYYRTDTHWNERGAKAAAGAIAASLGEWGLAPKPGQAEFRVTTEPPRERVGDLIRLAGLEGVPAPLRPRGDIEAASVIKQSAKAGTGLLDELPAPEVAVIGTSFSRRANFTEFLGMALGAPVADMAKDGGGLTSAAIAYFADPAFTKTSPHVIVWEIPERILEQPVAASDEAWAAGLGGAH